MKSYPTLFKSKNSGNMIFKKLIIKPKFRDIDIYL